jgi:hypothetical protein
MLEALSLMIKTRNAGNFLPPTSRSPRARRCPAALAAGRARADAARCSQIHHHKSHTFFCREKLLVLYSGAS